MPGAARPELLAIAPVYPPALAEAETFCTLHRRWLLPDADAFLREHGARIRVLVTTGVRGFAKPTSAHAHAPPTVAEDASL